MVKYPVSIFTIATRTLSHGSVKESRSAANDWNSDNTFATYFQIRCIFPIQGLSITPTPITDPHHN